MKDDLVMLLRSPLKVPPTTLKQVLQIQHYCLAMVASSAKRTGSNHRQSRDKEQLLLVPHGRAPAVDPAKSWEVIPIMNLCTFLREWQALHSIRDHRLVPLAPYLLKASPVVSQTQMLHIKATLEKKLQAWSEEAQYEANMQTKQQQTALDPSAVNLRRRLQHQHQQNLEDSGGGASTTTATTVKARLEQAIHEIIQELRALQVDTSVLRNTAITKTLLKGIVKNEHMPTALIDMTRSLLGQWKAAVSEAISVDTIRNLKGGKVMEIPSKEELHPPPTVSAALWTELHGRFNNSQLFAIKYVVDRLESSQDTRVCLVQGPPGTGKTSTIVGMVAALLGRQTAPPSSASTSSATTTAAVTGSHNKDQSRLLICTPSNAAVDEVLTRLATQGIHGSDGKVRSVRIVRLGDPLESSTPLIRSLALSSQVEEALRRDSLWREKLELERAIDECAAVVERGQPISSLSFGPDPSQSTLGTPSASKKPPTLQELQHRLRSLRAQQTWHDLSLDRRRAELRHDILFEAEVVGGTLSSSGRQNFLEYIQRDNVLFTTTIIDEAAQTTEPASLLPLRFGCRRLVLVGDPRQLPATVLSRRAEKALLGRSLFERLEQAEHEVVMLTVQYRMHPDIRRFPSRYFYQNLLVDSPQIIAETTATSRVMDVEEGEVSDEVATVTKPTTLVSTALITPLPATTTVRPPVSPSDYRITSPVLFIHVGEGKEQTQGKSFVNDYEVRAMVKWLESLSPRIVEDEDLSFAIISPYKAQVRLIQRQLRQEPRLAYLLERRGGGGEHSGGGSASGEGGGRGSGGRVEVNTVDGFQGREKDVVLFSAVRSHTATSTSSESTSTTTSSGRDNSRNAVGLIGFVADERRINVAITRAKKLLLLFGNVETLSHDTIWRQMIDDLRLRHALRR